MGRWVSFYLLAVEVYTWLVRREGTVVSELGDD